MLDAYNEALIEEKGIINENTITNFKETWSYFDPEASGFIKFSDLRDFLVELDKPLGFSKKHIVSTTAQQDFIQSLCLVMHNDE